MRRPFEGFLGVLAIGDLQIELARLGISSGPLNNRCRFCGRIVSLIEIKAELPIVERQVLPKRSKNLLRQRELKASIFDSYVLKSNAHIITSHLFQLA